MGSKNLGLFLLLSTYLCWLVSSSDRALLSTDTLQEHNLEVTRRNNHHIKGIDGDDRGIVHSSKFAHGGGSESARGGGSTEQPQNGNGGSNMPAGTAVIPVIVAGAANDNHHHQNSHRNGANCNRSCVELPILILTTFVSLISLISCGT